MKNRPPDTDSMSFQRPNRVKKTTILDIIEPEISVAKKQKKKHDGPGRQSLSTAIRIHKPAVHIEKDPASSSPAKRPRGRPPLSFSKNKVKPAVPKPQPAPQYPPAAPYLAAPTWQAQYKGPPIKKIGNAPVVQYIGGPTNKKETVNVEPTPTNDKAKSFRPPAAAVTKRILGKLMLHDPVSMSDLLKALTDTPKDLIQSVLDILRVMGFVEQYKYKETPASQIETGSGLGTSSSDNAATAIFSFTGFGKVHAPVEISQIADETQRCIESKIAAEERIKQLEELTLKDISRTERIAEMKKLLGQFQTACPNLREDPLYRIFFDFCYSKAV